MKRSLRFLLIPLILVGSSLFSAADSAWQTSATNDSVEIEERLYAVVFKNGSTTVDRIDGLEADSAFCLPTIENAGQVLSGWTLEGKTNPTFYLKTLHVNDLILESGNNALRSFTLKANWATITYTATFHLNGGNGSAPTQTVSHGATFTKPTDPTKTGYTFAGWTTTPGTKSVNYDFSTAATENIHLYAQWTNKLYTITWKDADGTPLATSSVAHGKVPQYGGKTPTKAQTAQYNFTFSGWLPTPGAITGDTTYTAQYSQTVRKYTVRWLNWNGNVIASESYNYNSLPSYKLQDPPKRTADSQYTYTFDRWEPEISNVTQACDYTAVYRETLRTYKISFVANGETIHSEFMDYGAPTVYNGPELEPTKTVEGKTYIFTGWSPELKGTVVGPQDYTAQFAEAFTVTFDSDGGSAVPQQVVASGAYATEPTPPTKSGFNFTGWYLSSVAYDFTTMPVVSNITLTAQWTEAS